MFRMFRSYFLNQKIFNMIIMSFPDSDTLDVLKKVSKHVNMFSSIPHTTTLLNLLFLACPVHLVCLVRWMPM